MKIKLHILFYFLSIGLSWSHYLNHEFIRFIRLTLFIFWVFFKLFLIKLHNFFYLLSMRLSWCHDLNHKFGRLTWIDSCRFFILFNLIFFMFYPLTLSWLGTGLHNLFWFSFYKVIMVSWPGSQIWHVNPGWLR